MPWSVGRFRVPPNPRAECDSTERLEMERALVSLEHE